MNDGVEAAEALLRRVKSSLNDEYAVIEHGAKAALAVIRATRELAALKADIATRTADTDEDALRAEVRRRIAEFVEAAAAGAADDELRAIAAGTRGS